MTAVTTDTLAAITERRAGAAANVVRIRPVLYSPVIAMAPMALAASTRTRPAFVVKASRSAYPWGMKSALARASCSYQYS